MNLPKHHDDIRGVGSYHTRVDFNEASASLAVNDHPIDHMEPLADDRDYGAVTALAKCLFANWLAMDNVGRDIVAKRALGLTWSEIGAGMPGVRSPQAAEKRFRSDLNRWPYLRLAFPESIELARKRQKKENA